MKKTYISATPPLMLLTTLPLIAVLVLSIIFNDSVDKIPKLYPLIIVSALGIIFTLIYLLRFIVISNEEIKMVGLFSSKDKSIINKNKTLILTVREKGRLIVTLYGNDGARPALDWAQGEDYEPIDINLFREKAEGKERSAKRVLKYFDVPKEDIDEIFRSDSFKKDYDSFTVSLEKGEDFRAVKIKFTKTT